MGSVRHIIFRFTNADVAFASHHTQLTASGGQPPPPPDPSCSVPTNHVRSLFNLPLPYQQHSFLPRCYSVNADVGYGHPSPGAATAPFRKGCTCLAGTQTKARTSTSSSRPPPLSTLFFSRNKDKTVAREKAYFDSTSHRRRLLIVGDKPGDADVNSGFAPDDQCLKIGFFDHSHEHPHPDLPQLPTPRAVTMSSTALLAAGNNGPADEPTTALEGLGFLRGANRLMLRTTQGTADAAVAVQGSGRGSFQLSMSAEQERIRGRPGSQGGGEMFVSEGGVGQESGQRQEQQQQQQPETSAVTEEELLRAYSDRFDVVACGGHSMDLVADFVRHFVGDGGSSAVASADAEARRHETQQSASPRKR